MSERARSATLLENHLVPPKALIFVNPIAGHGQAMELATQLQALLSGRGYEAMVRTDHPSSAPDAVIAGAAAAVSIGGDGTLRCVVERVTQRGRTPGPGVLVVPMGTANLMGRHLGLMGRRDELVQRAVRAIEVHRTALLDAGMIRYTAQPDAPHRLFLLMAGIGIDGEIVHSLDKIRSGPITPASYLIPSFGVLARFEFPEIRVLLDGEEIWPWRAGSFFAGNVREYGTGFPVLPQARSDDGVLDVCILPARTRSELVRHAVLTMTGEHLKAEGVVYRKGRMIEVESRRPVAIQADGDPAGFTPVRIDLLPARVAFIVP